MALVTVRVLATHLPARAALAGVPDGHVLLVLTLDGIGNPVDVRRIPAR